jgi:hypothetical protein
VRESDSGRIEKEKYLVDHVHLSGEGYRILTKTFLADTNIHMHNGLFLYVACFVNKNTLELNSSLPMK